MVEGFDYETEKTERSFPQQIQDTQERLYLQPGQETPLWPPKGAELGHPVLSILSELLPRQPKPRLKQKMMVDG